MEGLTFLLLQTCSHKWDEQERSIEDTSSMECMVRLKCARKLEVFNALPALVCNWLISS